MIAKYLYEKKGYPIDLNGNLVSYKETMESANRYINYKKEKFIEKARKYIANHFLAPGMDNEISDFEKFMKGE